MLRPMVGDDSQIGNINGYRSRLDPKPFGRGILGTWHGTCGRRKFSYRWVRVRYDGCGENDGGLLWRFILEDSCVSIFHHCG